MKFALGFGESLGCSYNHFSATSVYISSTAWQSLPRAIERALALDLGMPRLFLGDASLGLCQVALSADHDVAGDEAHNGQNREDGECRAQTGR